MKSLFLIWYKIKIAKQIIKLIPEIKNGSLNHTSKITPERIDPIKDQIALNPFWSPKISPWLFLEFSIIIACIIGAIKVWVIINMSKNTVERSWFPEIIEIIILPPETIVENK